MNPELLYVPPANCGTEGVDLSTVPLACFFGPYWILEDSSDVLQVWPFLTAIDVSEPLCLPCQLLPQSFCPFTTIPTLTRKDSPLSLSPIFSLSLHTYMNI